MLRSFFWRLYRDAEVRDHSLAYLFLELTRQCNLSCLHCGSDCRHTKDPELTPESWTAFLEELNRVYGNEVFLNLTGGEVLIADAWKPVTETIGRLGFPWGFVTNGQTLTRETLLQARDNGLKSVTLSIDGMSDSHDHLRGKKGAYQNTLRALDAIASTEGVWGDIVTCVHRANFKDLDAVAELLLEKNIRSWRLFRIFPRGRSVQSPELFLTPGESVELVEWIRANRPRLKQRGLLLEHSCEGYYPYALDRKIRSHPYFCRAGVNIAAVLADGCITGCSNNAPAFTQGNILKDSFADVWENRFQIFRNREWAKKGKCAHCPDWKSCLGNSIHLWESPEEDGPAFCHAGMMKGLGN